MDNERILNTIKSSLNTLNRNAFNNKINKVYSVHILDREETKKVPMKIRNSNTNKVEDSENDFVDKVFQIGELILAVNENGSKKGTVLYSRVIILPDKETRTKDRQRINWINQLSMDLLYEFIGIGVITFEQEIMNQRKEINNKEVIKPVKIENQLINII